MPMNRLLQLITPDWQITWDTKQIAAELPNFVFQGPGWYNNQQSWLLIINTDLADVYTLQAFFDRDPRPGFWAMAEAPVRLGAEPKKTRQPFQFGELLVLIVGLFILLPLSGIVLHKFGIWGMGILLAFAFLWGQFARRFSHRAEKKS